MGVSVKLKNVKDKGAGKYEFRKPYPPSLRASLGMQLRETETCLTEKALLRWYALMCERWEKRVAAERALRMTPATTPREQCAAGHARAVAMISGVTGLDEDEARLIVAETILARYAEDPEYGEPVGVCPEDTYTVNALRAPDAPAPEPTLRDAMKVYIKERIGGKTGRRGRNSLGSVERVFGYALEGLGKRADLPLSRLGYADGIKVRDFMIAREKQGGGSIKPSSVRREMNLLASALKMTIKQLDLEKTTKNIFEAVEIPGSDEPEAELRDPLPVAVIAAITHRLFTLKERKGGALATLRLMWRLIVGTGCRVAEVAGLRVADVHLAGPSPHIRVRWNEDRRVKTKTSIRSVPLCGDAFTAAQEALAAAGNGAALFSRYGGETGGNNASAALMKHVNAVSANPKHVVHSLRHNMADWLRLSGASVRAEKLILGHALGGVGDRVYGGRPADLQETRKAMLAAHMFAADEAKQVALEG